MLIEQGVLEPQNGGWVSTDAARRRLDPGLCPRRDRCPDRPPLHRRAGRAAPLLRRRPQLLAGAVEVEEEVIASLVRTRSRLRQRRLRRSPGCASSPSSTRSRETSPTRRSLALSAATSTGRSREWIQDVAPDRSAETVELAAYHYGRHSTTARPTPSVLQRAFESLLAASELGVRPRGVRGSAVTARSRGRARRRRPSSEPTVLSLRSPGSTTLRRRSSTTPSERSTSLQTQLSARIAELRSDVLGWRSRACWSPVAGTRRSRQRTPPSPRLPACPSHLSSRVRSPAAPRSRCCNSGPRPSRYAREAIEVALRVGDSFAEVNARINLLTQLSTSGVAPNPDETAQIVDEAATAGEYEEAYRGPHQLHLERSGFLPLDHIERTSMPRVAAGSRTFRRRSRSARTSMSPSPSGSCSRELGGTKRARPPRVARCGMAATTQTRVPDRLRSARTPPWSKRVMPCARAIGREPGSVNQHQLGSIGGGFHSRPPQVVWARSTLRRWAGKCEAGCEPW